MLRSVLIFRTLIKTGGSRCLSSSGHLATAKKINAIIIGPPGSGKGTISTRIVKDFHLDHLSSGDILRSHILKNTDFGKKIAPIVASGHLVPFGLLAPLMEHEIKQCQSPAGWLLDGYPRSLEQSERLQETATPNLTIYLNVPFATIIDRIKSRWIHMPSGRVYNLDFNPPKVPFKDDETNEPLTQREDDKPESVRKRLEVYQTMVDPVLEYYRKQDLLKEFAGTESNVIWPEVKKFLAKFQQS